MFVFLLLYVHSLIVLDVLKEQLSQKSENVIFLVEKLSNKERYIMKMINMGKEGTKKERRKTQKNIETEIKAGMTAAQGCPFLVRYYEIFYYEDFCCFIIEYCELGDLQKQLDLKKQYEESVFYFIYCFYYLLFNFSFCVDKGVKEMASSYWSRSFKTSFI
jgi:serine/threonine protein kinase